MYLTIYYYIECICLELIYQNKMFWLQFYWDHDNKHYRNHWGKENLTFIDSVFGGFLAYNFSPNAFKPTEI